MKYTCSVTIGKPIAEVVRLFDNPDNMKHWQPGLINYEPLSGSPGEAGARTKLHYKMGRREIRMIETIVVKNLPDELISNYVTDGVHNTVRISFMPINDVSTKYECLTEFKLSGFMKIMGWLMPGAFRKQTLQYMNQFKEFSESQP